MNKLEETLWSDYTQANDLFTVLDNSDERKVNVLEEKDKIRNELIKVQQLKNDMKIRQGEIEAENEREKIRNKVTILTFGVSTALSLYAIIRTFRFDQESTVTSTLGRSILNGVVPKMFKR